MELVPPLEILPLIVAVSLGASLGGVAAWRQRRQPAEAPPPWPEFAASPAVGMTLGLMAGLAVALHPESQPVALAGTVVLLGALVRLSLEDLRRQILPDLLTLPLIILGCVDAVLASSGSLADRVAGAAAGWVSFTAIALVYRWGRGRDGLGAGDAKLAAALGAWFGLAALPMLIAGAAASALATVGFLALATRRPMSRTESVPFGAFLCLAGIAWLLGGARSV